MRLCEKNLLMDLRTKNLTMGFLTHIYNHKAWRPDKSRWPPNINVSSGYDRMCSPDTKFCSTGKTQIHPLEERVIALSKIREHKTLTEELHKNFLQDMGSLC